MNDILFFPFHKTKEEQSFRRQHAKNVCVITAVSPSNGLLPFQIRRESGSPIQGFKIKTLCEGHEYDIWNDQNKPKFKCAETADGYVVYYKGDELSFQRGANYEELDLENGKYFAEIEFEDQTYYSEPFEVRSNLDDCLKITIWNENDIYPIKYNGIDFKQVIYLDTFIHRSEPNIEVEGERDDRNELIPTFQKITVSLITEVLVSDFLKNALSTIQIHEEVRIKDGIFEEFKPESIEVSSEPEADGVYAVSTINIKRLVIAKTGCGINEEIINENIW